MEFTVESLHTLEGLYKNVTEKVMDAVNVSNLDDLSPALLMKENKTSLANMMCNISDYCQKGMKLLRSAAEKFDELKTEQLAMQKHIIELQNELIKSKDVQLDAVHATVKTEIKTFSAVVQENCRSAVSPAKLKAAVKTAVIEEDRSRNVMIFGLHEINNENISDLVTNVL